ncbi:hypothetical protein AB4Z10_09355 [Bosea sp. RAF48]|uniref:hypothetical protein n=1 Tax=Bosea sp. RAF48 TaxID=3237480 RepID=UPI003F91AB18
MAQKKRKPEEIVANLRQADVLLSRRCPVAEVIRTIGVTAFAYDARASARISTKSS